MDAEVKQAYEKYAPKWFKTIRWREWAIRQYKKQYWMMAGLYMPVYLAFFHFYNPYIWMLLLKQPQTEEERIQLKKRWAILYADRPLVGRNWDIDKYSGHVPPLVDLWQRRKKYPEHYGDRYDIKAGDAWAEGPNPKPYDIFPHFKD